MTNIEHGKGVPAPAPEKQERVSSEFEQNLRNAVTPERALLIGFAGTKRADILFKSLDTASQVTEEQIKAAKTDDLPFAAGERVSVERRQNYWREDPERAALSFAEQNRRWNEGMHGTIRALIAPENDDQEKARKAGLAKDTLSRLELTGADDSQDFTFQSAEIGEQTVRLYSDIEAFRKAYFNQKSHIKAFVKKIAEQCPNDNGSVDIQKLTERLDAIKPILISFGDQSVDALVEDYAVSFGLLTQQNKAKAVVANEVKTKLSSAITPKMGAVYNRVAQKQAEIERETQEPQQPSAEPEPQAQGLPKPPISAGERQEEERREEPQKRPEEGVQPEAQAHQPERGEFDQQISRIEERLQEALGRKIFLSPRQKEILQTMPEAYISRKAYRGYDFGMGPITENEFIHIYHDQYLRLRKKGKAHQAIMNELDQIMGTTTIDKDRIEEVGERIEVEYEEVDEIGDVVYTGKIYPRIP